MSRRNNHRPEELEVRIQRWMTLDAELIERARLYLRKVSVTWDQIAGLEEAKRAIGLAVGLATARPPEGVELMPLKRILLYGPPGTGKTLLAAATSCAIRRPDGRPGAFFGAKVSELLGEGFGVSARIISALYTLAKESAPSVVFLDEFESIAAKRGSKMGDGAEERRILSTLLAELDGLVDKGTGTPYVLTLAATNRPWDLDRAVLSRFGKQLLVPLPDGPTRRGILELQLASRGYRLDVEWPKLLQRTESYSGRELERMAQEAVLAMLTETNAELAAVALRAPQELPGFRLKIRPIRTDDLLEIAESIVPQTSPEEDEKYRDWTPYSLARL